MKTLKLLLALIFLATPIYSQEYTGSTTPSTADSERDALKKVTKLLNDAKAGTSPLITTSGPGSTGSVSSTALEASKVLKASAGNLVSINGYNAKTSSQWIQVFNSATVPANGAVPVITFLVPASSNWSFTFPVPMGFTTGISTSNSSTAATKTIGSADCFFYAQVQ